MNKTKKKTKVKFKHTSAIKLDVFGCDLNIVFDDEWESKVDNHEENTMNALFLVTLENEKEIVITIYFSENPSPGLVAHESFHFVAYIYSRMGVELCNQSDEAFSHLLHYLVDSIIKIQKKLCVKNKRKKK